MPHLTQHAAISEADRHTQTALLQDVSRTFALTIPQLPTLLRTPVGNGYLLCRIADIIEDDPGFDCDAKFSLYEAFLDVLERDGSEYVFAARLRGCASEGLSLGEHRLIDNIPSVIRTTRSLPAQQRESIVRCIHIMCNGMYEFQVRRSLDGLGTVDDMNRYCYVVAGVVGEMLTDLFCDHSEAICESREALMQLAVSFGQGLQMTNILKDVWEDRDAGNCWLPKSVFRESGEDLSEVIRRKEPERLAAGIDSLVGLAHGHLHGALAYSCLIPKSYVSIRRFCLWAVGLALLTLQRIYRNPGYENGRQVKISRRHVRAAILSCNTVIYSNRLVRAWFELASLGLPLVDPAELRHSAEFHAIRDSFADELGERRGSGVH